MNLSRDAIKIISSIIDRNIKPPHIFNLMDTDKALRNMLTFYTYPGFQYCFYVDQPN